MVTGIGDEEGPPPRAERPKEGEGGKNSIEWEAGIMVVPKVGSILVVGLVVQ